MPYPKLATLELLSPGQATSRHSRTHTFPSFPPRQRWIWIRAVQKNTSQNAELDSWIEGRSYSLIVANIYVF